MTITTLRHEQLNTGYGEFYVSDSAAVSNIRTASIYHPLFGVCSSGLLSSCTFVSGEENSITAVADGGGGTIKVTTANPHGYSINDYVTIIGTTDYNGNFQVLSLGNSSEYYITKAYTSSQTGYSIRGDRLVVNKAGNYQFSVAISCSAANANKTFSFSTLINTTVCPKCRKDRFFSAADTGAIALTSMATLTAGSWVRFCFANLTDTTDITIKDVDFNIKEI